MEERGSSFGVNELRGEFWEALEQVNAKEGLGVRSSGTSVTVGRVIARTMAMRVLFYQMDSVLDGGFDGWDHSFTAEGVEGGSSGEESVVSCC